jgi:hypothetical protein
MVLIGHTGRKDRVIRARCMGNGRRLESVKRQIVKALEESTVWKLSMEQQKAFVEAVMYPPAPNRKLQAAFRRYETIKALSPRVRKLREMNAD